MEVKRTKPPAYSQPANIRLSMLPPFSTPPPQKKYKTKTGHTELTQKTV